MKKQLATNLILIVILLAGLSLMLYPTFSDWWNSSRQTKMIENYSSYVEQLDEDQYQEFWQAARDYNAAIPARKNPYLLGEEEQARYPELLNIAGNGVMGYIQIPAMDVSLPIYHTTDEAILQVAVGHLEWTSLPVGGESSHAVLSGHRGLPSARLFTDLDRLVVGDIFTLRILDEILTYEVDQILIVLPEETEPLQIQEGKDLCTLVTCTPYGINTHRLLVRGHRIDNIEEVHVARVTADAVMIEPLVVAPIVAFPILFVLLLVVLLQPSRKYGGNPDENM